MQHVDEGQLHAYLDGELTEPGEDPREVERHLAECAECRALLEEVKLLRERGRSLLVDPLPVEQPPFEEVIARASRPAPQPVRAPRRVAPLAWAASILVALGAGWLGSDLLRQGQTPQMQMAASVADSAPSESAPAPDVLAVAPAEREEAARVGPGVPPPSAPAAREAAAKVGTDLAATAEAPLALSTQAAPAQLEGLTATGYATERRTTAPGMGAVGAAADRAETVAMAPPPPPPVAERAAPAAAPAPVPASVARATAARSTAARAFSAQTADGAGWTIVDRATAEQRLGAPLATVPELRVLGIEISTAGASPVVRVRQQLPGGQVLTLLAERVVATRESESVLARTRAAGEGAGAESRQANAEAQAARRIGAIVLSARASIPADSLTALLARAR